MLFLTIFNSRDIEEGDLPHDNPQQNALQLGSGLQFVI